MTLKLGSHLPKKKFLFASMKAFEDGENCSLYIYIYVYIYIYIYINWDSLHARLNSHNEAWSYKKSSTKKKIIGYKKSV